MLNRSFPSNWLWHRGCRQILPFPAAEPATHIIHPYLLKEYRNRWYMVGWHDMYKQIRTYELDRIQSLEKARHVIYNDQPFDPADYYGNTVGINTYNKEPAEIRISFTREQAQYVLSQPMHGSQEVVSEDEGEIIIRYKLIPTFEFKSQLLGWSDQAEVLSPEWFRKKIKKDLKRALDRY